MPLTASLLAAAPLAALLWGVTGHRAAAIVTYELLPPAARVRLNVLLQAQSLADASTWADEVRNDRPATGPLHYVNIHVASERYIAERDCPRAGCVVSGVEQYRRRATSPTLPPAQRREAVKFVLHFLQDLHQPLHVGDRRDRGGNDVEVEFLGRRTNLHRLWDTDLFRGLNDEELATLVRARVAELDTAEVARGSVVDWVMEGQRVSRETVYAFTPGQPLGPDYAARARDVAIDRLARAAVRTARVLTELLAARAPAPPGPRSTTAGSAAPRAR